MNTNFDDVVAFQLKYGLPVATYPTQLPYDQMLGRMEMMHEELVEMSRAYRTGKPGDVMAVAKVADALIDLVYFALGTAAMMGIPWEVCWDMVQRANMQKIRCNTPDESKRDNVLDVRKPEDWVDPVVYIAQVLDKMREQWLEEGQ